MAELQILNSDDAQTSTPYHFAQRKMPGLFPEGALRGVCRRLQGYVKPYGYKRSHRACQGRVRAVAFTLYKSVRLVYLYACIRGLPDYALGVLLFVGIATASLVKRLVMVRIAQVAKYA